MRSEKKEMTHNVRRGAPLMTEWCERFGTLCLILAVTAMVSPAQDGQIFATLHSFDGTDGLNPYAAVIQATDGNLYGTTDGGGANGSGTIFKITPGGTLTTLHSFGGTDGLAPQGPLVQATDGNFYGTTFFGGNGLACQTNGGCGTLFKITPSGTLTTLYSFCSQTCADGANPESGMIQATGGNFYGTTYFGGTDGVGTVFKITPSGSLTTLHSFDFSDGFGPNSLIQADDGNFYGTTSSSGANGYGTVFKITPNGTLTTLYNFNSTDGSGPNSLIQADDGNFYGTTSEGGTSNSCFVGCGTVFEMTSSGILTSLHSFDLNDGSGPTGLIQATDGNFYGTTIAGGGDGVGTVFKVTPGGVLTTLHRFDGTDGELPFEGLVQETNGKFYGTTSAGGNLSCNFGAGCGTVFGLSAGLHPFVETVPTSGKVGEVVKILGTNLTGATAVSFNGAAAVYKVVSKTVISATVPTGATTGLVTVTTPSGTLKSSVKFRVRH